MIWQLIHIIDILLWLFMAGSVAYIVFFAIISLFHRTPKPLPSSAIHHNKFLILYPAYHEDRVILSSVRQFLSQDYPTDLYTLTVISDHMQANTNEQLSQLPITLLQPAFEKSSKAKALQYAIAETEDTYDYVIILDADNIVDKNFLQHINKVCQKGYQAIQCHRCAKNSDNNIAVLDGVSEEINNTIFRRAHNIIGLSSALIGSGMCFSYQWFKEHVCQLCTAVEDRELEALLARQGIYVKFEDHIYVYDEKVSNAENFQRQRLRWMTGQIQSLIAMMPYMPHALLTANLNYIDKTLQQALIPRSILLITIPSLALAMTFVASVWSYKWWWLFFLLIVAVFIAIPSQMRTRTILQSSTALPRLALKMLRNIRHIDKNDKEFIHTEHQQ